MPGKTHSVPFEINDRSRFIAFSPAGIVYGSDMLEAARRATAAREAPWAYNRLYDFRRLINAIQLDEFVAMADQWRESLAGMAVRPRCAFVTPDPLRKARGAAFRPLFVDFDIQIFDTIADAEHWLNIGGTETGTSSVEEPERHLRASFIQRS